MVAYPRAQALLTRALAPQLKVDPDAIDPGLVGDGR
jgi:hypothetical protein